MSGIVVFTDGSSRGNPGPGGFGAIVATADEVVELGGRDKETTNNRMELAAELESLRFLSVNYQLSAISYKLTVYSDSSYLINGITKWVHGWRKNDWKTKAKEPVLNRDLWEALDDLDALLKPAWKYVAGHAGHGANERCDEIATGFADGIPVNLYKGPRAGYRVSLAAPCTTVEDSGLRGKPVQRSGAAYSYVSKVDGVIQTHKTWKECEARVKGAKGARYKKALSAEQEAALIAEFSGD